jgi:hypothetical protein
LSTESRRNWYHKSNLCLSGSEREIVDHKVILQKLLQRNFNLLITGVLVIFDDCITAGYLLFTRFRQAFVHAMSSLGEWSITDSPDTKTRSMEDSGKSEGGAGGGFSGLPAATVARVGVLALARFQVEEGTSVCGGLIGKGEKMCVNPACTVTSHQGRQAELDEVFGTRSREERLLFIKVPLGNGSTIAVFIEPVIPASLLDDRYSTEKRTVSQWTSLFKATMGRPEITSEEVGALVKRTEKDLPRGFTPRKKLRHNDEFMVGGIYDDSFFLRPVEPSLNGESVDATVGALRKSWSALTQNQETIFEFTSATRTTLKALEGSVEEENDASEFKLYQLQQDVGERQETSGTKTLFQLTAEAMTEMDAIASSVRHLNERTLPALEERIVDGSAKQLGRHIEIAFQEQARGLEERVSTGVASKLAGDVNTALKPLVALFSQLSSDKATPGDKLKESFARIQAQIDVLVSTRGGGSQSSGGMSWLGSKTHEMSLGEGTDGKAEYRTELGELRESLATLQAETAELRDQQASRMVEMGCISFVSKPFTRAWLTGSCRGLKGAHVLFVDGVSLIHLVHGGATTLESSISMKEKAKRAGLENINEAKMLHSFELELPAMFGAIPSSGVDRDDRVLPSMPTFNEWESKTGHGGAKQNLKKALEKTKEMRKIINEHLSGEAQEVAKAMLDESKSFIDDLSTWITNHYNETIARSGATEKECWSLVGHCVRAIFAMLYDARGPGRPPYMVESDKAASTLWGGLQAHRVMAELREADFGGHPKLSHILNIHLHDNSVSRVAFERLSTQVAVLQRTVDKLPKKKE